MSKIVLIVLVVLSAVRGWAQSTGSVIDGLSSRIISYGTVYATYNFSVSDSKGETKFSVDGEFYSQGDMFLIKTYYSDIYCDGESKYIHNKTGDELILLGHDKGQTSISENPFSVLTGAAHKYKYPSQPHTCTVDGVKCHKVTLTPVSERADHVSVDIVVTQSDYTVKSISYFSKGGDVYRADVRSISGTSVKDKSFFQFDYEKFPDVMVNDLR